MFRTATGFDDALASLPEALRAVVGEALARLVDYQDRRYALAYLERLRPFASGDPVMAGHVARHLALWMTYEDAIRVADLKTRRSRFERIRREARSATVEVVDYLKPDLDELYGILPYRLAAPLARWAERRWPRGRPALAQHVRTTTVLGYLRLWLLGRCRWLRPHSYRARLEHARLDRWLAALRRARAWDAGLAADIAQLAQLVKGYGEVRRRLAALFDEVLEATLVTAEQEALGGEGFARARHLVAACRIAALRGPEGEAEARTLVSSARGAHGPRALEPTPGVSTAT